MREQLAKKIEILLKDHTKRNHNNDFVGPDAYCMEKAMKELLDENVELKDIQTPNSEMYSGCYKRSAESVHDEIMNDFKNLLNKECLKCKRIIEVSYMCCPYCGTKN